MRFEKKTLQFMRKLKKVQATGKNFEKYVGIYTQPVSL